MPVVIRALKGRLGDDARPRELALSVAKERIEPFRARALAEPALQRTVYDKEQIHEAGWFSGLESGGWWEDLREAQ